MIVLWAIVTVYALAAIIHTYEKYDRHREQRIRELVTREARNPLIPPPQPVPVGKHVRHSEPDDSWLISHDEVLRFLSPSLVLEFTTNETPSSVSISHHLSPSEARELAALSTERSEVPGSGALKGSAPSSTVPTSR